MSISILRSPRLLMALVATTAMLALSLIAGQSQANAAWSTYCNPVTLGAYGDCIDSPRKQYQLMGWGDQHSVCVQVSNFKETRRCSAGPGHGVYTPTFEPWTWYPLISNNAKGTNTVHGISFQP